MANRKYDQLMKRWLTDQVTEKERINIEAWLKSVEEKKVDNVEMTDAEAQSLYEKFISEKDNIKEIQSFTPESLRRKDRSRWILRAAAGLLIIATAGFALWRSNADDGFFASEGIRKIKLNDGTLVWVHPGGKVSYYENKEGRFADLEGEALFEVAKDAAHPFIIHCADVNIKVVGTSFSIKTGERTELKVLTGKVNFSSVSGQKELMVQSNEMAIYSTDAGMVKSALPLQEVNAIIANTDYNMAFRNATFSEVGERIEKKFDVKIKLENDQIGKCHVNLDITDHSLESSLQIITSVLNVEYQVKGETITFTGSGCK